MAKPRVQSKEVEAKFFVQDSAVLQELAKPEVGLEGYRFSEPQTFEVTDLYLDTSTYKLLRYGFQLRMRAVDGIWQATLKSRGIASEVGIYERIEIEVPLHQTDWPTKINDLPEVLVEALSGVVGKHQGLDLICTLEQTRVVRSILSASPGRNAPDPQLLAQLSLDELCIRQSERDPILARAFEVEIELVDGIDMAELQVLADRFMGAYGLIPSTDTKLERALGIVSRHPVESPESWQGISHTMHMGEACRIIWHEQFMTMLLKEAGIRSDSDPESVHQARVAIRRARAAARLYRRYFKSRAIQNYLKRLRRTAQFLGEVRDLDVAIGKLEGYQRKTRKKSAGDLQATLEEWLVKRALAYSALMDWLDSDEYATFVREFMQFFRSPGAGIAIMEPAPGEDITPSQVRHVAPAMLLTNFAAVRAYETWFERPDPVPVETLHRLRIACKYLRYNLEFLANLLGPESSEIIARLRKLQDDLGELNDAVVSKQLLATDQSDTTQSTVARYDAAQEKIVEDLRSHTSDDFAGFVGEENRQRLLSAIGNL